MKEKKLCEIFISAYNALHRWDEFRTHSGLRMNVLKLCTGSDDKVVAGKAYVETEGSFHRTFPVYHGVGKFQLGLLNGPLLKRNGKTSAEFQKFMPTKNKNWF